MGKYPSGMFNKIGNIYLKKKKILEDECRFLVYPFVK